MSRSVGQRYHRAQAILLGTAMVALTLSAGRALAQDSSISPDVASTLELQQIDFGNATLSQAGPHSFYVRGVKFNGNSYSLTIGLSSNNDWTVTGIYPEDQNVVPPNVLLDFASVSKVTSDSVVVDGIIMNGSVYQGTLKVQGPGAGVALSDMQPGNLTEKAVTTADQFRQLLFSKEIADFQKQLAAQQQELQARNDKLQQERDSLQQQLDAVKSAQSSAAATGTSTTGTVATGSTTSNGSSDPTDTATQLQQLLANNKTLSDTNASLLAQNQELLKKSEDLLSQNTDAGSANKDLSVQNQKLQDQISALMAQKDDLDKQNQWLATQVDSLKTLVTSLQEQNTGLMKQVADLESQLKDLRTVAAASTGASVDGSATGASGTAAIVTSDQFSLAANALHDQIASVQGQISDLDRTISLSQAAIVNAVSTRLDAVQSTLSGQIADLVRAGGATTGEATSGGTTTGSGATSSSGAMTGSAATPGSGATGSSSGVPDESALRQQISQLQLRNQQLTQEKNDLEKRVVDGILKDGYINLYKPMLTHMLYNGFQNGDAQIGTWRLANGTLSQLDPSQYFAKYALPVPQVDRPTLYSVSLRAAGPGWVGVGLHIFVSDVEHRSGYGLGKSLLVWLTRDRQYYKNDSTYLQLYRSDDDVNMGRVLDAKIAESIGDYLKLEVLYEPKNEYITIAVNGQEKIRYKTWFGIDAGVSVALRTLGSGASFTGFQVQTTDSGTE